MRDAYLAEFADLAPHDELVTALELASRVAKVARALVWERAMRAAAREGAGEYAEFAGAPMETLFTPLDDSYL